MSHRLLLVSAAKTIDITPIAGNISWSSDIDTLGQQLSFQVAYSDTNLFPKNPCDVGDMVILVNGSKEVYRGIIVSEERNGREPIGYNSFDMAFYLNQSTAIYQFNRLNARQAIIKVASDFGVPIGSILPMATLIKKIYMDETPAGIIEDIISKEESEKGYKLRMEMRQGKLYIEKRTDSIVSGTFQLAANLPSNSILDAISEPVRIRSIEEMRNQIKIVLPGSGESYKIAATESDQSLINRYGLLQHTETIDKEDVAKARQIARNKLKELGRVNEDVSIKLIGNDNVRAGRLLELSEPITGLTGKWLIKNVSHDIGTESHTMLVKLGVVT